MEWLTQFGRRLLMLLRRRQLDQDLEEEMRLHLELREQEQMERGLAPDEAWYAARRQFGNPTLLKEVSREMWGWNSLEQFIQDLRYGLRQLRLSPGFAVVAILSLALGIGANTAIFQLLDAVRFRNLPIPNPEELAEVRIVGGNGGMGVNNGSNPQLTRPIWQELRERHEPFSGVFAWGDGGVNIGQGSETRWRHAIWVSGEFFRVLGVQPWRGRMILPEDEGRCPASLAVVSYSYWQGEMGGRELGAGSTLLIDGDLAEVVGVAPPQFFGLAVGDDFDIAIPFCQPKDPLRRDVFDIAVMGRLRPEWTLRRASAQLEAASPGIFEATALTGRSAHEIETYKHFRLAAYPASTGVSQLREQGESSLWLLLAITGLVLLIACTNLANLMLARASTRQREMAVRLALGASRRRLLRQLLAESVLLAAIGAALGIGLAGVLSRVLVWSFSTEGNSVYLTLATDWRVLLFAAAVAALTCLVFGAAPALRASKAEPMAAMKSGGRGVTSSREHFTMQRVMVVTEIAVSLVLLVGAFLFVRSFRNLMTFDPGMREAGITVAILAFQQSHLPPDRYAEFKRQLLEEVRSTPGILGAATTTNMPLLGGSWEHGIHIGSAEGTSKFTWVSPGYFETMGIPLLTGRDFNQNDTKASQRVAVVNKTFVRRFLGNANPIGKTLRTEPEPNYPSTVYQIVGLIPDTQYSSLRGQTPPMTFVPASQYPAEGPWTAMMIHSNAAPDAVASTVKRRIAEKHPEIVTVAGDFQTWIRNGLVAERLMAMLSGFFGLLAALLAMVGLYGMISYAVARRQNEIGIRLALGAQRGQVIGMVMREAGRLLVIGVAAGTALSLAAGRWASSLLFGLKPYDPLTLITAGLLSAVIAALASFLPARRASKLDPVIALRCE
jgi:putative ABC transport system permease protein